MRINEAYRGSTLEFQMNVGDSKSGAGCTSGTDDLAPFDPLPLSDLRGAQMAVKGYVVVWPVMERYSQAAPIGVPQGDHFPRRTGKHRRPHRGSIIYTGVRIRA